jgi:hypothetical protein
MERVKIRVMADQVKKGDRLTGGWVVKSTLIRHGEVTIFAGKSGYRGQHPTVHPYDKTLVIERPVS